MVSEVERRVIDATKQCWARYGFAKTTIDDISDASGVSRATIYRLFPGGKDVLFEALRVDELTGLFDHLAGAAVGADGLDDLVARLVSVATRDLRDDEFVALMLASEPGEILSQLTVDGLPRIMLVAGASLEPLLAPYLTPTQARPLIDLLVRLTISYFLAPSPHLDLGDHAQALAFVRPLLAAFATTLA